LDKEITEARAAFVLPEQPLSSANARAHLGSGIFRFLFVRGRVTGCRAIG
jgi:hypothetical protein